MPNSFEKRFDIPLPIEEARTRFVNMAFNKILRRISDVSVPSVVIEGDTTGPIVRSVLSALGRDAPASPTSFDLDTMVPKDFWEVCRAIEALYGVVEPRFRQNITNHVRHILSISAVDLGVRWHEGQFLPTGARLLDEVVINDPLNWLRDQNFPTVLQPFEKALRHFTSARQRPELHSDVITDAYEALEALARVVCENEKELSANREQFISRIRGGNDFHGALLKLYVVHGCTYRHAEKQSTPRPPPSRAEAEFFLYQTGLFLRFALENTNPTNGDEPRRDAADE